MNLLVQTLRIREEQSILDAVECIEAGDLDSLALRVMLQGWVEPLLAQGCDTLILGCTHYPFIRPLLSRLVPRDIRLIDTGAAVARHLGEVLTERGRLADGESSCRFYCSGDPQRMAEVLPTLWGEHAEVELFSR